MKKLWILLPFFLALCGCSMREIDRGYLVNSIGFSEGKDVSIIFVEATSSSDTTDKPSEQVVLSAVGATPEAAFDALVSNLVKPLYFKQLGVAVFEKQPTEEQFNFLKNLPDINYGIYLVKTDDINTLFDAQTPNGILGYDIIGLLKTNGLNCQLYKAERDDFALPTVNFTQEKLIVNFG